MAEDTGLERLLAALKDYERINGWETVPAVVLYADGSGYIKTEDAGKVYVFGKLEQGIEWLEAAVEAYIAAE